MSCENAMPWVVPSGAVKARVALVASQTQCPDLWRKRWRKLQEEAPSDEDVERRKRQEMRDDLQEWLGDGEDDPPAGT